MNEKGYHTLSLEHLFKEFESNKDGLSQKEAEKRLEKYGENEIKKINKLRPFKIFFGQFKSFLIYILVIASIISFLIGRNLDGIVILSVVILNASIGFFQQYKAEKAIIGLKKILIPTSRVIRDGKYIEIVSSKIVPGDILILSAGDKINADCRIIEAKNLQANEAILTGESLPIDKKEKIIEPETELADRFNMLYTGTQIVRGSGKGLVVSTGEKTEFGKIASTLQEIKFQKTPIQKRLDAFSKQVGFIILIMIAGISLIGLVSEVEKVKIFLTAVALAVSAIPEGLPAVLAISFSISSLFMAKKNVIIRKLPAVESLGSVTVICTDKTGTITEEKMHVQEIFSNNKTYIKKGQNILFNNKKINIKKEKELFQLIKTGLLCNNARFEKDGKGNHSFIGDPTEESLVRMALDLGISKKILAEKEPRINEFEFDSGRKMMSIVRDRGINAVMYSKGAVESILSKCKSEYAGGQIKKISKQRRNEILRNAEKMEEKAFRVLGFAFKNFGKKSKFEESGLIFLGFAGMIDPPRKEVKYAVKEALNAGIKIKMITGDSLLTAKSIANQIGLIGKVVSGAQIEEMNDEELKKEINSIVIFARTTPQQKLRITNILQRNGETVAITGDGINDILALKSADIGISMGIRGTDIARDVSDIVLSDDNFSSIIEGVKEGRKTYDNIKKFTKYFLAVNFSQIFLILSALILNLPLPLLPLQILWINLITDSFPALTLVFEKQENVMKTKPRQEKSLLDGIWKFVIAAGILAFLSQFFIYLIGFNQGMQIEKLRTIVLTTAILFELLFVYVCRSSKPLSDIGIFSNKWMNYAILFSFALHLILIYSPLSSVFGVTNLALRDWLLIIPFAISGLVIFEAGKYWKKLKRLN